MHAALKTRPVTAHLSESGLFGNAVNLFAKVLPWEAKDADGRLIVAMNLEGGRERSADEMER